MTKIKIIDVTLRDGGYRNNFNFDNHHLDKYVTFMDKLSVDFIEVGYRNGSFKKRPNIGNTGKCNRDYLVHLKKHFSNSKMAVIFHPHNVELEELHELHDIGVDLVRICFPMNNKDLGYKTINEAKRIGLQVSTNLTRVTQYDIQDIVKSAKQCANEGSDIIYLADSNGSLTPQKTECLFSALSNEISVPLGFHAHNNLDLAMGNSISAIKGGAEFIDASIMGMGKGSGNLKLEVFLGYLNLINNNRFNLSEFLEFQEFFAKNIYVSESDQPNKDLILAAFNLSQDDSIKIGEYSEPRNYIKNIACYLKTVSQKIAS